MTLENPYRAAGAFAGKAYIRRGADAELVEQIRDNQYYPYFAAPRQSGKSSLIARTMSSLPAPEFRCALIDLSPFVVRSYDDFWRQFLHDVARSANFDPAPIGKGDPREVFIAWLTAFPGRLVIFVDEIDVLLHVECREQIFSKIRTFFNLRAHEAVLQRLTFVLAGAAHSSRFISDPRWSPFNVAIEIALEDLSTAQVSQLASYLATAGAFAGPDLVARVFELTAGSVFLCQLVFEALWNRAARVKSKLDASDVDVVVTSIVAESPRNIHFYNIFRLVTQDARLAMLFRRLIDGEELGEEDKKELQLTGLCRGMNPFRNEVYARVFGAGGPLDLKVAGTKVTLGRKLEAALTKRQQLTDDGEKTTEVEAEIAALKREFREGAQLREGDVLARGRYRLIAQIGQGGFATVWHARDEPGKRDVALKVLHGQFAEDKSRRDRFFRGAWKMSELRHPAVVQVYEPYGEEAGRHFFVMEYMSKGTLHEAVLDKRLAHDAVIAGIVAVGQALAHAHERGLVHRDVKPSNVLLGEADTAKLTDFDLVREQDAAGSTRTGPMGSFIYSAPEVLNRPQDADHRADIYGLAMTAVFGLHGAELPLEVVRDADRFIDRLRCGGLVKDVLKKGVAWEIERRFTSAAEFTQALGTAWGEKDEDVVAPSASLAAAPVNEKKMAPTWTAMFATLPLPEAGPLAKSAPPGPQGVPGAAPARVVASRAAPAPAPAPARDDDMMRGMEFDAAYEEEEDAAPPRLGMAAPAAVMALDVLAEDDIEPPPRVVPEARHERVAAAAPVPVEPPPQARAPGRGVYAALAVFASAALVLLALQIAGPNLRETAEGHTSDMAANGSEPGEPRSTEAPKAIEGKRDEKKADKSPNTTTEAKQLDLPPTTTTLAPNTAGSAPERPPELPSATTSGPEPAGEEATDSGSDDETDSLDSASASAGTTAKPNEAKAIQRKPRKSLEERIEEGCFQVRSRNAETGVRILKDAREDSPKNMELLGCLADGLLKISDYSGAETYAKQLIQQYPRHLRGWLGAAQANENMARYDLAAKYYQQVQLLDPENKSAEAFLSSKVGQAAAAKTSQAEGFDLPK